MICHDSNMSAVDTDTVAIMLQLPIRFILQSLAILWYTHLLAFFILNFL